MMFFLILLIVRFVKLEEELNEAQTIYILSASVLENVGRASDNEELRDQAQDNFDLDGVKS